MSGQMFSLCGQKAGLGRGACPRHILTMSPCPPRPCRVPISHVDGRDSEGGTDPGSSPGAVLLSQEQQGRSPCWGGMQGAGKRAWGAPGDGDSATHTAYLGLSVGPWAEGGVQPVQPSRTTKDPCPQPGIAEGAVPSSPRTQHVHTPHSHEGPNPLCIKTLCIPDAKHNLPCLLVALEKGKALNHQTQGFSMCLLQLMNLCQSWGRSVV